ncbi:MAG: hypothetical protein B6245_12005 [Desulfobacteraceae bacterium 4572_88]|nr:MAG: hypothetical protein B6245_12005 [Desulfobacteraceae bacterium 4572_88]
MGAFPFPADPRPYEQSVKNVFGSSGKRGDFVPILHMPIKFHGAISGIIRICNDEPRTVREDDPDSFCLLSEYMECVIENNGLGL